jgi:hypothetical protein
MWELIKAILELFYSIVKLIGNALLVFPQMIVVFFSSWLKLGGSDLIATKIIAAVLIALLAGAGIYVGRRTERKIVSLVSAVVGAVYTYSNLGYSLIH